ncbi:MAG: 30S ribosomal protein S2, partial [Candidatus Omnitrophica bacterium CG1_02_46_14]
LLEKEKNREMEKYTKKEISAFKKEIAMLQEMFEGVKEMDRLPDFVFIVDVHKEKIALREAVRLKIPVVAIVDSNGDPSFVNYIIPANDDAVKSVKYILNQVQTAFLKGRVGLAKLEPRVEKRVPKPDTAVKKTVKKTAVKSA